MEDQLRFEVEDGVGTLTLNRPERRNAMSWELAGALLETESGHGRFVGVSAMPSSQVIYGIVVTLTLNRDLGVHNAPGVFGLGLLTVSSRGNVVAVLDPAPYRPRTNNRRKGRLLKEFAERVGDPEAGGCDGDSTRIQRRHGHLEAKSLRPDPVPDGNPNPVEHNFDRGRRPQPHLPVKTGNRS